MTSVGAHGVRLAREALSTKTANRDVGNMRLLYGAYFKYICEEDRPNPFLELAF